MTVREKETVLDERVVQRTEEVSDPITGIPTLTTYEYVEKTIETEVSEYILSSECCITAKKMKKSAFFN